MDDISIKEYTTGIETDKVGRPCKYESHVEPYLDKVYEWLKEGYTDYSISDQLGIDQDTWIKYKKTYSVLSELYTRARTCRNALVMNAQFGKAKGIKEKVPKAFKIKEVQYDASGKKVSETEKIEYADEYIFVPPDVNAADLYLRNNSEEYKSAKADVGGLTLIQNNYQLPQLQAQLLQIDEELKRLEIIDSTATEVE